MSKVLTLAKRLQELGLLALRRSFARTTESAHSQTPQKILILGYAAIGDLVFILPMLTALRRGFPQARLVWIANAHAGTDELLPATGLVDEIWRHEIADLEKAPARRDLARSIGREGFDAAIASLATPIEPFARAILPIPLRIGHFRRIEAPRGGWSAARYALWRLKRGLVGSEFERRLALNRPVWADTAESHSVLLHLKLLEPLGLAIPKPSEWRPQIPEPESARAFAEKALPPAPALKTVALHLGSPQSQYAKIWPAERWGAVCRRLAETAPLRVALVGGADEEDPVRRFQEAYKGTALDLTRQAKLLDTFAVIRRADLLLSSDTGLSKAAMALGTPTAVVWGPSDRPGWGAPWDKEKHLEIFLEGLPCSPCVKMGLPNEGSGVINFSNCGHRRCLADLTPDRVVEAILRRHKELLVSSKV